MPRRRRFWKAFLLTLFAATFYCEFLSYRLASMKWPNLPNELSKTGHESIRILLVADPQLQGENNEPWGAFGWLTRYDADAYLQRSFALAISHLNPDAVVFLGDLLDEGSVANEEQMGRYRRRFANIFRIGESVRKVIHIPGDNDVGGEGGDWLTPEKVAKFRRHFAPSVANRTEGMQEDSVRFANFYWSDRLFFPHEGPGAKRTQDGGGTRVLLSHFPVMPYFSAEKLMHLRPHVIFSAHTHSSHYIWRRFLSSPFGNTESVQKNRFLITPPFTYDVKLETQEKWTSSHEFVVPTCSYRMGVPRMGYGAAILDESGRLTFAILWLPSRFVHLAMYGLLATLIVGCAMWLCCCPLVLRGRHAVKQLCFFVKIGLATIRN